MTPSQDLSDQQDFVPRTRRSSVINVRIDGAGDETLRLKRHPPPVGGRPTTSDSTYNHQVSVDGPLRGRRPVSQAGPRRQAPSSHPQSRSSSSRSAPGPRRRPSNPSRSSLWLPFLLGGLLAGLGFAWLALDGPLAEVFNPDRERTTTAGPTTISALTSTLPSTDRSSTDARLEAIQSALGARGSEAATVERDGSIIRLTGSAASEAERQAVLDAVEALVEPGQLDASGFVVARIDPSQRRPSPSTNGPGTGDPDPRQTIVARELERLLDATPVAFGTGESALEPLHLRILNNVALVLAAYPDLTVSVIGFPDTRTPDGAGGLSQTRADAVRDYLVAQGIDPENLVPAGWDGATPPPSDAPLGHVEFRVGPS